jgi:hypothetical protein
VAETNYTAITILIETLTDLNSNDHGCSESSNRHTKERAQKIIPACTLDSDTIKAINNAIGEASNPSGYYFTCNGIRADIKALEAALIEQEEINPAQAAASFNYRNFRNLVSDGSIFYVEFIKRSTGTLRKMRCRTGVKKHLKGGKKAYNSASKGLLSIFDMEAKC